MGKASSIARERIDKKRDRPCLLGQLKYKNPILEIVMKEQTKSRGNLSRPGEIIDFVSLAKVLWHWRFIFVYGFILLTVIGALIVFLAPKKYRSEAVFQVGALTNISQNINLVEKTSMPIPFFKEGETRILDLENMHAFMTQDQTIEKGAMDGFFKSHKKNQEIKKYFEPFSSSSQIAQLPQVLGNDVIGFKLFYKANTADSAQKIVKFFGNYIRSSYLAIELNEYIQKKLEFYHQSIRENESMKNELKTKFAWTTERKEKVQLLSKQFPLIKDSDQRQLILMKNTSTYFLSPKLNLMGIEALMIDINEEMKRLDWEKELSVMSEKFFNRANELLERDATNGIAMLEKVMVLKNEFFSKEKMLSPAVRHAEYLIQNDLQRLHDVYSGIFKFVSGPTVFPDQTTTDRIWKAVGIMVFNFVFMLLLVLLIHWGKRNWQEITAKG